MVADKAYSSGKTRRMLAARGIKIVIPQESDEISARERRGSRGGRPPSLDQIPTLAATSSSGGSAWPNNGAGSPPATTSTPLYAEPLPPSARYRLATQIGDTPWSSGLPRSASPDR